MTDNNIFIRFINFKILFMTFKLKLIILIDIMLIIMCVLKIKIHIKN